MNKRLKVKLRQGCFPAAPFILIGAKFIILSPYHNLPDFEHNNIGLDMSILTRIRVFLFSL